MPFGCIFQKKSDNRIIELISMTSWTDASASEVFMSGDYLYISDSGLGLKIFSLFPE